ncbi:hypothetical protein MMC19_002862 [Ptychographa xylographoides]|nr:hypothetical protein [Ptychographa xylographoides]
MSSENGVSEQPPLVSFYDPSIASHNAIGRTLSSILAWNDRKLEASHDYIQFLFPLPEGSGFNWAAPVIDRDTFNAFRSRPELRARLKDSFVRMLTFYGFELRENGNESEVIQGPNFPKVARNWVTRFDHNHLRITRIIRSLRILGLESEAHAFYSALSRVYQEYPGHISQKSMMFWTRADARPLYLAPEDANCEGEQQDFLIECEMQLGRQTDKKTANGNGEMEVNPNSEQGAIAHLDAQILGQENKDAGQ